MNIKKVNKINILYLPTNLDIKQSLDIEQEINSLIQREPESHLLLNMSSVKYISSSALRIIVSTMRKLTESGRKLKLCEIHDSVKETLETTHILDLLDISVKEEDALKKF